MSQGHKYTFIKFFIDFLTCWLLMSILEGAEMKVKDFYVVNAMHINILMKEMIHHMNC